MYSLFYSISSKIDEIRKKLINKKSLDQNYNNKFYIKN